jgi:hypothetical protein
MLGVLSNYVWPLLKALRHFWTATGRYDKARVATEKLASESDLSGCATSARFARAAIASRASYRTPCGAHLGALVVNNGDRHSENTYTSCLTPRRA